MQMTNAQLLLIESSRESSRESSLESSRESSLKSSLESSLESSKCLVSECVSFSST